MAWKAKTFAKTLMTVALEIPLGLFSAMTDRFGYAKPKHRYTVFSSYFKRALYGQSSQHSVRGAEVGSNTINSARRSTPLPDRYPCQDSASSPCPARHPSFRDRQDPKCSNCRPDRPPRIEVRQNGRHTRCSGHA